MEKITRTLIALTLFTAMLCGCNIKRTPPDTTENESTAEMTSEQITETTANSETERPDYLNMEMHGKDSVSTAELGLRANNYTSTDPMVADIELLKTSVRIYVYNAGTTTVKLTDCFGHEAEFVLTVDESYNVTKNIIPCTEKFIEVSQFGAKADGSTDDSAAIQAAIDSAKAGETVYIYPGIYKASYICMKEGITLKMYTTMTDATEGLTDMLAQDIRTGKVTVLVGARFMNNTAQGHGSEGCNNFTISGGVLDMNQTSFGAVIFGCADNARLENIIFKDIKGNHAIQYTGCKNSSIVNCMFAGYVVGDTFTREVVQIEPSTTGATGSSNPPLWFSAGEYNYPENITIDHCYFGESDEAGAPLMAIGHHSQAGFENVTGFKIINNVFDECLYAAIRYNNIVDTEISGNTFITTNKYNNTTSFSEAVTPSFIIMYHVDSVNRYNNIVNNLQVTKATAYEQGGIHNLKITDNTFTIGKGADKKIFYYEALANYTPGATCELNMLRQDKYNSNPYAYSGYLINRNYGENVEFSGNTINIEGQPNYKNFYMYVANVYNFIMKDNKINIADSVSFSVKKDPLNVGMNLINNKSGTDAKTQIISAKNTVKNIYIRCNNETVMLTTQASLKVTLKTVDGGSYKLSTDEAGNLYADLIPEAGYTFTGFFDENGNRISGNITLTSSITYTAQLTGSK